MKQERVQLKEAQFLIDGKGLNGTTYVLEPFDLPVKGEDLLRLKGITCRHAKSADNSYFFQEKVAKEKIVLHFTAGYLVSDINALSTPGRPVSTAFVLARDGTAYQMHSSAVWSYHLGPSAIGGNKTQSSKSIGIEICNFGYLKRVGNELKTIYDQTYCTLEEEKFYQRLEKPFRGQEYFATFTDAQYDNLIILLRYLTSEYDIPRAFLPEPERYEATDSVVNFRGILSHINFRVSGKWDIGPAFDWERVIAGVTAATFAPGASQVVAAEREVEQLKKDIESARQRVADLEQRLSVAQARHQELLDAGNSATRGGLLDVQSGLSSEKEIEKAFPPPAANQLKAREFGEEGLE